MKKKIILFFLLLLVSNCFSQHIPQFLIQPPVGYQINLAHPRAQGLVGKWLVHEGLGLKWYDLTPYGNDGTLTNMDESDWVVGRDGGWALDFDGINDFVDLNNDIGTGGTGLTLSIWVNPRTVSGLDNFIDLWFSGALSYKFRMSSARISAFIHTGSQFGGSFSTSSNLLTDEWAYLVLTYDGATLRLYKNAVEDATTFAATGTINTNANNTRVGESGTDDEPFDGSIANIEIYDHALKLEEIEQRLISQYAMFEQPPGRILAAAAAAARRRLINWF